MEIKSVQVNYKAESLFSAEIQLRKKSVKLSERPSGAQWDISARQKAGVSASAGKR